MTASLALDNEKPILSVVIGIRNWGLDRLDVALRSHLTSNAGPIEVVISDYGSENCEDVRAVATKHGCRYIYTPASVWSRSAALNAGIKAASSDNILTTDADILFSPKSHEILLRNLACMPNSVQIIQCRDLPEQFGSDNLVSFDWDRFLALSTVRPRVGMGGSATFKKALFFKIHGFDERMTVWGGEDNDFVQRAQRSGALLNWVENSEAQIYHIWHPPDSRGASVSEKKTVKQNRQILQEDHTVLRNLAHSYRGSKGYVPTVSIVIATKNRPELLKESVASCLNQTYQDFELVVVDDGSDEEILPILKSFGDDRIRMLRLEESRGLAFARNRANAVAKGEFIAIHDDDDLMLPQRLEHQLRAISGNYAGSYGGWIDFNDETGKVGINPGRATFDQSSLIFAGKTLVHAGTIIRRKVLEHYRYNEAFVANSDYHLINRIARGGVRLVHCGHYVILRRLHSHNLTGTHTSTQKSTAGISQAMSRGTLSARLEQVYRENAEENAFFAIDTSEVMEAATHLPPRLLRRKLRIELEEPIQELPASSMMSSIMVPGKSVGIEFTQGPPHGISAFTLDTSDAGSIRDELLSELSAIVKIRHAGEVSLPLAYSDVAAFEADCGVRAEFTSRERVPIDIGKKLDKITRVLGKHCNHCTLFIHGEHGYQIGLPRLKKPVGNLLKAKLSGLVSNN